MEYQERWFMQALAEFEKLEPEKRLEKKLKVSIDDNGICITLGGIAVTYSIPLFQNEPQQYLEDQAQKHKRYAGRLDALHLESARENSTCRPTLLSSLFFRHVSDERDLDSRIRAGEKDLVKARLLKQAAIYGKQFFGRILVRGEDGLLQDRYEETFRRYPSLEGLEELNQRLGEALGGIERVCTSLVECEMEKTSRLQEQKRLHYPGPE